MKVFVNKRFLKEIDTFKVLQNWNNELKDATFENEFPNTQRDSTSSNSKPTVKCQNEYGSDVAISLDDWEDCELPSKIYFTDSASRRIYRDILLELEPQNCQDLDFGQQKSGLINKVLGWIGVL